MNHKRFMKLAILLLAASTLTAGMAYPAGLKNNEVEFSGSVQSISVNGDGIGTLFVSVNSIELRVLVNSKTIIQDRSEELITMEDLSLMEIAELRVNVQGKYSSGGVLASRIRVVENDDSDDTFLVRGQITKIQESGTDRLISLLGIDIVINEDTLIKKDGVEVPLSSLQIGTKVAAIGDISGGVWTATQIHLLSAGRKRGLLLFEGTVESYVENAGEVEVAVNGVPGDNPTLVHITAETKITGVLEAGAYVLVIGTLNIDYSVTAREIRVLAAIEIIPDGRKLDVGEEATFTIKLREAAGESGVTVNLEVDDTGILELLDPSAGSVVIEEGQQTAEVRVKALAAGETIITATLGETDETAAARVQVQDEADDDAGQPQEIRAYFSPDHIKMLPNDSREVVLHINPPQSGDVDVLFEGGDGNLVVEASRMLGIGSAKYKVKIQSTDATGSFIVTATLPEELESAAAAIEVTVAEKRK